MRKYVFILLICFSFTNDWDLNEVEYLIYTKEFLSDAANSLYDLHENDVDINDQLKTKIILDEEINSSLNEYIFNNFDLINGSFTNLKYLVIIGDESVIPPLYNLEVPCDDCFSSENINTPNPKLITGRILASNLSEANTIIDNTIAYSLNPASGDWKSELLLLSDDQFKNGELIRSEKWHTLHSEVIYNKLKNNLNINCMYGPMFDRLQSIDWYTQPDFTDAIIHNINQGVGIINYIGHGTSEFLADENILTYSDIDRISIGGNNENHLPIWIVGTCAFGNYTNENCLAQKILTKGNAGIAVISATGGVTPAANFLYLKNFFSNNLYNYLNGNQITNCEGNCDRLGDLFYYSKDFLGQSSSNIHLFGDPALKLQISKLNSNLIDDNIETIDVGTTNTIEISNNSLSTLRILNNDRTIHIDSYDYTGSIPEDSCLIDPTNFPSCLDNFEFTYNGETLYKKEDYGSFNFILPIDAVQLNSAIIKIQNDADNHIQIINNISLTINEGNIINDNAGPIITILQNNSIITDNSTIYPPYDLRLEFEDDLPINISGFNYHDIRLWIDDNETMGIELNDYFQSTNQGGFIDNYTINVNDITQEKHIINIEAWDILNNRGYISYIINFYDNDNIIYNVYNFPNPFEDKTFFTFGFSNSEPIIAKIDIYTLNGEKIYSILESLDSNNEHFYNIEWNGIDNFGNKISNGIYLYHLEIFDQNNENIHSETYKLAKSK